MAVFSLSNYLTIFFFQKVYFVDNAHHQCTTSIYMPSNGLSVQFFFKLTIIIFIAARIEELRREKNVQLSDLTRHYELLLAEVEKNMSALHKEEIRRLKEERSAEVKEAKRKQWVSQNWFWKAL